MIDRTLIHVTGPAGAGKTALVEALLGRIDESITCGLKKAIARVKRALVSKW